MITISQEVDGTNRSRKRLLLFFCEEEIVLSCFAKILMLLLAIGGIIVAIRFGEWYQVLVMLVAAGGIVNALASVDENAYYRR